MEAIDYISKNNDLIVILDHVLPDITGQAVMKALAEKGLKVPIIVITGKGNEKLAVDLIKQGASDYLVKDSQLIELLPSVIERVYRSFTREKKLQKAQMELLQKNRDNEFLANLSFQLADSGGKDIVKDVALPLIKKHTGAFFAHFATYNQENKTVSIKYIESDNNLIESITSIGGENIFSNEYLVSDSQYQKIFKQKIIQSDSLYELSGGSLPESVSKVLKKVLGYNTLFSISQIHKGELYGETTLAFSKAVELPSEELLESFANILAVSLRNSIAESSLIQSEEKYRKLAANASDIIWTMDLNFNLQYVSPSVYKILGFSTEEYLRLTMSQKFTKTCIDQFNLMLRKELEKDKVSAEKNRAIYIEAENYSRKGYTVWLAIQVSFIRDKYGEPIGVHGISRDITKRKLAEEQLSQERERLANIIEGTNAATWEWNIQTGETYFNERWAEIIGYSLDEISPTSIETWIKFTHPDDLKISGELLEKHFAGELDFYDIECRMKHKHGHWVWVLDHGKVFSWSDDGKPLLMRGTHQEISKRKQAEQALRESENSLRLSNSQKDLFFQILAHDLKNPMGAMYRISELLSQKHNVFSNEKRQKFIDQLYNISSNTYSLLDELLLWGNSQAGKLPFQPQSIKLEPQLSELVKTLQPLANNKGISIDFSIPKNTEVLADKDMLNAILRNLITNAIKFTDKGGHIQINSAIDRNQATITVADNGVGMDRETIDSLFKLDKKTTTKGTNNELGTGFGLKLCLEFVEKHGGKIWAESEVGKGSEFKLLLPKT